jgi:hypothetical protein
MEKEKRNLKDSINFFVIVGVVGVLLFIFLLFDLIDNLNFRKNAVETMATITRITSNGNDHTAYIEYIVNGTPYNTSLSYWSVTMRVGQQARIFYNADNPNEMVEGSFLSLFIPILVSLLFISVGVFPTLRRHKRKNLKEYLLSNGKKLQAKFTEIEYGKIVTNGNPSKTLVCEYMSPSFNLFTFKSEPLWNDSGDLEQAIGKGIDVYVDPSDFSKYYVDDESVFDA